MNFPSRISTNNFKKSHIMLVITVIKAFFYFVNFPSRKLTCQTSIILDFNTVTKDIFPSKTSEQIPSRKQKSMNNGK